MTTRTSLSLFLAALGLAAAAGCYTGPGSDLAPAMRGSGTSTDGTEPVTGGETAPSGDGGAPVAHGLPCDVAEVLATSCTDCHGTRPSGGAPNALVTYDDLVARAPSDPDRSVAEVSLARMKATKRPMPPDGPLDRSDVAVLERWVAAGMPRGSCETKPATPDAAPSAADAGPAPKDAGSGAASVCTSGVTATPGTPPSALMQPGKTCIACHSATGGPSFELAGTVYPTLHEPDRCNGVNGALTGVSVLVIDAAGKSHTMPVNAAGNFMRVTGIPMPYRAMVVKGSKIREMKTLQTDGDCNGCHSEKGSGAPGRIMVP